MRRTGRVCGAVAALVLLAALTGCSSTSHAASRTTTSSLAPRSSPARPDTDAHTLAAKVVTEVHLPTDSVRSTAPPPALLHGRQSTVGFGNLVGDYRMWTTRAAPSAVIAFVQAHVSSGYFIESTGTGSVRGVQILGVIQSRRVLPANISIAQLQVAVVNAAGGGAVVRVDSLVGWTAPKPSNESVASTDRVAVATRAQGVSPVIAAGRVVVSDPAGFRRLQDAFDGLRVAPPDEVVHCPAISAKSFTYTVAFSDSEQGSPDIVATTGVCRGVTVLAAGKHAPALDDRAGVFLAAVTRLFP
ncbi:MAG: hypothetical protein QOE62_612 [Actinomycetota bacterium]|nr:hypothetical protein [Actinomycetota bacterium]